MLNIGGLLANVCWKIPTKLELHTRSVLAVNWVGSSDLDLTYCLNLISRSFDLHPLIGGIIAAYTVLHRRIVPLLRHFMLSALVLGLHADCGVSLKNSKSAPHLVFGYGKILSFQIPTFDQ